MLQNGKDVDPVVLENVLVRFSTCQDNASVRYVVILEYKNYSTSGIFPLYLLRFC